MRNVRTNKSKAPNAMLIASDLFVLLIHGNLGNGLAELVEKNISHTKRNFASQQE